MRERERREYVREWREEREREAPKVRFESVEFTYPSRPHVCVLKDVTLTLAPGIYHVLHVFLDVFHEVVCVSIR